MKQVQRLLSNNRPLPPVVVKFALYFLTGGTAAIVDIGGFALLARTDLSDAMAATLSYVVAVTLNYFLTTHFIYATRPSGQKYIRFLAFAAVGLCINVSLTLLALSAFDAPPAAAKAFGVGVAFFANFLMVNFIVFKAPKD